jgi:hypothetical protein
VHKKENDLKKACARDNKNEKRVRMSEREERVMRVRMRGVLGQPKKKLKR